MKVSKRAKRDARRLYRLCLVNGLLDADRMRLVIQRLGAAPYRKRLALLSVLRRLVKLDADRHTARVRSAVPLPPDLRQTIEARISSLYGPGLSTTFADEPALIGGVRITVGSDVFDGSVRGALASLEAEF